MQGTKMIHVCISLSLPNLVSIVCRLKPLLAVPSMHRLCCSRWILHRPQCFIPVDLKVFAQIQHALALNRLAECDQQILSAQQHNMGQTPLEQSVQVRDTDLAGSLDYYGAKGLLVCLVLPTYFGILF